MGKLTTLCELPTSAKRQAFLEQELRRRTREWIQRIVNEELEAALGCGPYERTGERRGYRKGARARCFTTTGGKHTIRMPRGAYFDAGADGTREWRSELIPRYARRTEEVESALVLSYLSGTNTRKIARALGPLLDGAALSKSTVSRIVERLAGEFGSWRTRDLAGEDIAILFLDGFHLKVRIARKVESLPVLAVVGVRTDGTRVLVALELRTSESEAAWRGVCEDLAGRGVKEPVLAVIDGNKGLRKGVKATWPQIEVQRCTKHKLENLLTHTPKRLHAEVKADFHAIVYAGSEAQARAGWGRFERKWEKRCAEVVASLWEGGEELVTFLRWPRSMWKMLRTTNGLERLNGEFRRRVKTQGSLPTGESALMLLYGLFATGIVTLRRVDGWREMAPAVARRRLQQGHVPALDAAA